MPQVNATVSTIRNGSAAPIPIQVDPYQDGGVLSAYGSAQYEIQKLTIRGIPNAGTWSLLNAGCNGGLTGGGYSALGMAAFDTGDMAFDADATVIKTAINDGTYYAIRLLSTGTNVSNGNTVTINGKVYTFKTTLTPTEGEVLIGANATASFTNLSNAINHTGTPGTDYSVADPHPQVTAEAPTTVATHLSFLIKSILKGPTGAYGVSKTGSTLSFSFAATTLLGSPMYGVYKSTVGSQILIYLYWANTYVGFGFPLTTAISNLPGKAVGEIQRIAWDAAPGAGFWYMEDADGVRTDGITFDADDATIAASLNLLLGAGQIAVTQVPGVSIDVRWLLSPEDQPLLDIFTDHLFTAESGIEPTPSDTKAPVIQQVGNLFGVVSTAFSHIFTALNSPDSWTASGVPEGMAFNETTSALTGSPTTIGDFYITVRATNEFGTSAPMTFVLTVLPSAAAAGGRRLFLDLSQRVLAYKDTLAIADPLEVSLEDASFIFETRSGVIIPGVSNPGRLELRAAPMVNNTADFNNTSALVINEGINITAAPVGQQLLVIGEDWGADPLEALFSGSPDPMSKTLLAQLRWRNGDDVAGHYQHSKVFKVTVSNTLFWP